MSTSLVPDARMRLLSLANRKCSVVADGADPRTRPFRTTKRIQ